MTAMMLSHHACPLMPCKCILRPCVRVWMRERGGGREWIKSQPHYQPGVTLYRRRRCCCSKDDRMDWSSPFPFPQREIDKLLQFNNFIRSCLLITTSIFNLVSLFRGPSIRAGHPSSKRHDRSRRAAAGPSGWQWRDLWFESRTMWPKVCRQIGH